MGGLHRLIGAYSISLISAVWPSIPVIDLSSSTPTAIVPPSALANDMITLAMSLGFILTFFLS